MPAYNEEKNIKNVISSIKKEGFFNIIVVDDWSTDNTFLECQKENIFVLKHIVNLGWPGGATSTGLEFAKRMGAEIVVTMDSDWQHLAIDIKKIIKPLLNKECDVVIGSRFKQKNKIPLIRRFFNTIGNFITFLLTFKWVTDSQSWFKAFWPQALSKIHIEIAGYDFCTDIIRQISYYKLKTIEIPINVKYFNDWNKRGQNFSTGMEMTIKLMIRSFFH